MAQSNTSLRRENGGRTIWHQDKKKRTIWHQASKQTIWHQDKKMDNLALENIFGTGQFGTSIVKRTYPAPSKKYIKLVILTTLFPFCSLKRALKYQIITFISNVRQKNPERSMFSSSLCPRIKYRGFLLDGIPGLIKS